MNCSSARARRDLRHEPACVTVDPAPGAMVEGHTIHLPSHTARQMYCVTFDHRTWRGVYGNARWLMTQIASRASGGAVHGLERCEAGWGESGVGAGIWATAGALQYWHRPPELCTYPNRAR